MILPSTNPSLLLHLRDPQDEHRWKAFIELYTPVIYQYGRSHGLSEGDSQDVVQEVFLAFAKAIGRFSYDPRRGKFRNWLIVIARRAVVRHKQGGLSFPLATDVETFSSLSDQQEDPQWADAYQRHLWDLAAQWVSSHVEPRLWSAFELTWLGNATVAEAASILGVDLAWVHKARFKVLRRLKERVETLAADTGYFT